MAIANRENQSIKFADRSHLIADERGSVIGVTNGAGAVTTLNTYDAYGVRGSGNGGLFQYTGQIWLSELGLYHYKARAYDPKLGRFLQTDPIGVGGGMNLYAYAGNDPVNRIDPLGLCDWGVNVSWKRWNASDPLPTLTRGSRFDCLFPAVPDIRPPTMPPGYSPPSDGASPPGDERESLNAWTKLGLDHRISCLLQSLSRLPGCRYRSGGTPPLTLTDESTWAQVWDMVIPR